MSLRKCNILVNVIIIIIMVFFLISILEIFRVYEFEWYLIRVKKKKGRFVC